MLTVRILIIEILTMTTVCISVNDQGRKKELTPLHITAVNLLMRRKAERTKFGEIKPHNYWPASHSALQASGDGDRWAGQG